MAVAAQGIVPYRHRGRIRILVHNTRRLAPRDASICGVTCGRSTARPKPASTYWRSCRNHSSSSVPSALAGMRLDIQSCGIDGKYLLYRADHPYTALLLLVCFALFIKYSLQRDVQACRHHQAGVETRHFARPHAKLPTSALFRGNTSGTDCASVVGTGWLTMVKSRPNGKSFCDARAHMRK